MSDHVTASMDLLPVTVR